MNVVEMFENFWKISSLVAVLQLNVSENSLCAFLFFVDVVDTAADPSGTRGAMTPLDWVQKNHIAT